MNSGRELEKRGSLDIRAYLDNPKVKEQVRRALPKHMNADRMLRVAFTSIMKNPKLLECTLESLLSAIIQSSQLGLEPVLGRAHLVPYWNGTKKCYEAQFQVGYQGLVELCRRTGELSDVWAEVIYERDNYRITFGLDRNLVHEPNFEVDDRGRPVGGYAVFKHKDGTLGWSYLPISKIYSQHRAKSQGWLYAVKQERTDTPWISDEEEMIRKTMIKHQSKVEPMSIELQAAIAADNASETGAPMPIREFSQMLDGGGVPPAIDHEPGAPTFDELAATLKSSERLDEFVTVTAEMNEMNIETLKANAVADWSGFVAGYERWVSKHPKAASNLPPHEKFSNLKVPGLRDYWKKHAAEMRSWPPELKLEWNDKIDRVDIVQELKEAMYLPISSKEAEAATPQAELQLREPGQEG